MSSEEKLLQIQGRIEERNRIIRILARWCFGLGSYASLWLYVYLFGDDDAMEILQVTLINIPVFFLQITLLLVPALVTNWIISYVRSRPAYDKYGPVRELRAVQDRVGTKEEQPNDALAMARQHFSNSVIISTVILCFFLMRSGTAIG